MMAASLKLTVYNLKIQIYKKNTICSSRTTVFNWLKHKLFMQPQYSHIAGGQLMNLFTLICNTLYRYWIEIKSFSLECLARNRDVWMVQIARGTSLHGSSDLPSLQSPHTHHQQPFCTEHSKFSCKIRQEKPHLQLSMQRTPLLIIRTNASAILYASK